MSAELTQQVEDIMDKAREQCADLIQAEIERVCNEWQAQHPKRTVWFIDAMGSQSIDVDGKTIAGSWVKLDPRVEAAVQPLISLYDWYISVADNPNVACEHKVGPNA